jgi:hypothetical protein
MKSYVAFKMPGFHVVNSGYSFPASAVSRVPAVDRNGQMSRETGAACPNILVLNSPRPE